MATVGSLNIKLGLDVAEFTGGLAGADSALGRFAANLQNHFRAIEQRMTKLGIGLTAAVTLPFGLMSKSATKASADFETAMNKVQAALRPLTPRQIDRLREAALSLGPAVGMSATEAADAISTLGFAGMKAEAILGGGLQQTLIMAKANMGGVEESAALAIDVLKQFNLVSADMAMVNQQVTGGLDETKWAFDDYRQAIAQAGGVAGGLGVQFGEFNAALAATATVFGSGSDAGTAFKSFLTSLRPTSEEAGRWIEGLGLKFYEVGTDKLRPLGDIAEELREKIGRLSEGDQSDALKSIFGTDAMRTAIALMRGGREEIERLQEVIGNTNVQAKLDIMLQGLNQELMNLSNAAERLKIALGDAGLLFVFTTLTAGIANLVGVLADLPLGFHVATLAIGALLAVVGPLLLLFTKVIAPLILSAGAFGRLGVVIAAIVNPLGFLVIMLGRAMTALGLTAAAARLTGAAFTRLLGPIGLAIMALGLFFNASTAQATASHSAQRASDAAGAAFSRMSERAMQLANATGEARKQIMLLVQSEMILARVKAGFLWAEAGGLRTREQAQRNSRETMPQERIVRGIGRYLNLVDDPDQLGADATEMEAGAARYEAAAAEGARLLTGGGGPGGVNIPNLGARPPRVRGGGGEDRARQQEDIAYRREMLALNQQLAVARAREDHDAERAIERTIDLKDRTKEYRDLEFGAAEARTRAASDLAAVAAAETVTRERNLALGNDEVELEVARTTGAWKTVQRLQDERYLRDEIEDLQRRGVELEQASIIAGDRLLRLQQGRVTLWRQEIADRAKSHELELAELRGDTARAGELRRQRDIDRRSRDLYQGSGGLISRDEARAQAVGEVAAEEEARLTGVFRDTFRDGMMAALNGDFEGWFKRWWTDQLTASLEDALNSVADLLRQALKGGLSSSSDTGGGLLGAITGIVGSLLGRGASPAAAGISAGAGSVAAALKGLPKFATGGSFEVGGRGGIDQNLVSFWATKGEMVNVQRGESASRPQPVTVHVEASPYFDVTVDGRAASVVNQAAPHIISKSVGTTVKTLSRRHLP